MREAFRRADERKEGGARRLPSSIGGEMEGAVWGESEDWEWRSKGNGEETEETEGKRQKARPRHCVVSRSALCARILTQTQARYIGLGQLYTIHNWLNEVKVVFFLPYLMRTSC